MDLVAAVIGLLWNALILILLWRAPDRRPVFFVLAFYLVSLYTADRILPRVLVDAWPNFDALRSPALRPVVILPDVVLLIVLARQVRRVSPTAALLIVGVGISTIAGLAMGLSDPRIPASAAMFWATVPLRGIAIVLLLDAGVRAFGWARTGEDVSKALIAGALFLAVQVLVVVGGKYVAGLAGIDLASIWSGFDWVRPNLPGWNNNITASMIGFGAATILLLPDLHGLRPRIQAACLVVFGLALVFAEYRTAIIALAVALGTRVGLWTFGRTRHHGSARRLISATATAGLACALLLTAAGIAVPRLGDLNPLTYVAGIVGPPASSTPIASESAAPGPIETPVVPPDLGEGSEEGGDTSTSSRAQIVQATLHVWLRQPVFGPGLGAWEFTRPTQPTFLQKAITPHNGVAWVLADLGAMGFIAFYALPALLVLTARPPFSVLVWLALLALLEIAIVGVAHSRYAAVYWSVIAFTAIGLRHQIRLGRNSSLD